MRGLFSRKSTVLSFLLPALIIYTAVVFFPIIWSAYHSFFNWNGFSAKKFTGLDNFVRLFTADRNFWPILIQTFIYTILQIILQVGGGLVLAILLSGLTFGRSFFQAVFYIPVIISSAAICQIFTKLLSVSPVGIVNAILGMINPEWEMISWLTIPKLSLVMCALVEGYKSMGTYMVIFYAALIAVPDDLIEAATIDGANAFRCLVFVKLPYIMHIIIANIVLVLNNSFRSFDIPYLLTAGGPGTSSELLASFMYKRSFSSMQYGYGSAIATVIVMICFILAIFCMRVFRTEEE